MTPPPSQVAPSQVTLPGVTAPPPSSVRPPGMNYLDDMITLKPQYEAKSDLVVKHSEDGSVLIEPSKPPKPADDSAITQPSMLRDEVTAEEPANEEAVITRPRMNALSDKTDPSVVLPESQGAKLGSHDSSHNRGHNSGHNPGGNSGQNSAESSWARGLAARLDAQLEDDFGTETPISAPTKAELQALLDSPPDPTRRQSIDEIEKLHQESLDRASRSSQELELDRRRPFPTAEVDEADIEAAIELAPPARRNAIGVAKKKREE
jgi:hypothetical protein